jgi:hypothetical protein
LEQWRDEPLNPRLRIEATGKAIGPRGLRNRIPRAAAGALALKRAKAKGLPIGIESLVRRRVRHGRAATKNPSGVARSRVKAAGWVVDPSRDVEASRNTARDLRPGRRI